MNLTLYRPSQKTLSKIKQREASKLQAANLSPRKNLFNLFTLATNNLKNNIKTQISCLGSKARMQKTIEAKREANEIYCEFNSIGAQSNAHKMEQFESNVKLQDNYDNETVDYGYFSIPRTETNTKSFTSCSYSSLETAFSSGSSKHEQGESHLDDIKAQIESFLGNMQLLIDSYVRPSVMFKVLSVQQALDLYQNVEKLIPVTKFMLNIVNSHQSNPNKLPNAELVRINFLEINLFFVLIFVFYVKLTLVFDSFKTYLNGLPNAIELLGELSTHYDKFIMFLEVN